MATPYLLLWYGSYQILESQNNEFANSFSNKALL